jgi:transcriptional regulator with XRE-family HTH domain
MTDTHEDPSMVMVRAMFEESGLSLHDLGVKMGYDRQTARQSAWQFMKTGNPRIDMLRRFAAALDVPVETLLAGKKKSRAK